MARIIADDLMVYTDCAMMIANGELGQGDEEADRAHAAVMANQWPEGQLVLSGGEDDEPRFSWMQCDGCGSTLAGDRERAAVLR